MRYVESEVVDGVGWLRMVRTEKRNALNQAMKQEMVEAIDHLDNDNSVLVIILTGSDGAFAAGSDVTEIADSTPFEYRESHRLRRIWDVIDNARKPVIAAINGLALGGGCELALSCDVRIAAENAKLGQPEINLGLIPGAGGTQRLPRLVGEGQAMRLVLTGDAIDAQEAARIGLVDEVVPDDELLEVVTRLAQRMARHSPVALELAKEAVGAAKRTELDVGLAYERQLMALTFAAHDRREGVTAFLEKRAPRYVGR